MRTNKTRRTGGRKPRLGGVKFASLTPQAKVILQHLTNAGTITQREALMDHSVQSLTKRISEIRKAGYEVPGVWKLHPLTGQRYMRYSYANA